MVAANSINESTTGICGFTGTAFVGTALTAHDVLVGGSTSSTITNVAPSSTSGVPLISQGSSSDPAFGTAVVAGGGTGLTSATAYAVLCGGTTSTGNFQSIASVGTSGQVLTSNGAGALPTFQAAGGGSGPVQQTRASTSTSGSTTTTMPIATAPQNTDGFQLLSVAITPTNSSHVLIIEYSYFIFYPIYSLQLKYFTSGSALFQDSTATCIYASLNSYNYLTLNSAQSILGPVNVTGRFAMTAGTTSSTTFKLRIGLVTGDASGTLYYLQDNNGNNFGGKGQALLTVTEWVS